MCKTQSALERCGPGQILSRWAVAPDSTAKVGPNPTVTRAHFLPRRYTCVAAAEREGADWLLAGAGGGRLRWLDPEAGRLGADVLLMRPSQARARPSAHGLHIAALACSAT